MAERRSRQLHRLHAAAGHPHGRTDGPAETGSNGRSAISASTPATASGTWRCPAGRSPPGYVPDRQGISIRVRPRLRGHVGRTVHHAVHRCDLRRPHVLGRQLAHAVSRAQQRPAGERSRAGRHHDGLRRAHQRDYSGRSSRLHGNDARIVQAAARGRGVRSHQPARVRRELGLRPRRPRHSEFVRGRHRRPHAEGRRRDSGGRPLLAGISAAAIAAKRSTAACA